MRYLLDTNTAVDIMRHPRGAAADRFIATSPSDMAVSIVVKAELLVGPYRQKSLPIELPKVERFLSRVTVLSFDDLCAVEFAKIAAFLLDSGTPVDGLDIQIAATARRHGLSVVTRNMKDFGKIPALNIENWIV